MMAQVTLIQPIIYQVDLLLKKVQWMRLQRKNWAMSFLS
uniref:Uncharacterized protein n=1 Tax=Rhizophora mucronata TaxID=61149 RepID=A0A2P2L400_RHIMU